MAEKRGTDHVKVQKEGKARDLNVCQICGSRENVEGHHILDVQYGGAANVDNIIALCRKCHQKVHKGLIDLIKF
jgi:5-methylcytosine-specific restriction endonuclease McrA